MEEGAFAAEGCFATKVGNEQSVTSEPSIASS